MLRPVPVVRGAGAIGDAASSGYIFIFGCYFGTKTTNTLEMTEGIVSTGVRRGSGGKRGAKSRRRSPTEKLGT